MTTWTVHRPARSGRVRRIRFRAVASFGAITLVTGLIGLVPGSAQAAGNTYYVAQGGSCSDSASGTSAASAFCSIKAATKKATSGDTITVGAGDYHEQVEPAAGVAVMTAAGATISATDPATDAAPAVTRSYGIKLLSGSVADGFTVQGATVAGIFVASANGATVRNVRVSGSNGYGIYVSGGSGNTVTGARSTGNASVGVLLRDTTASSVLDSTASGNNNHGVSVQGGSDNRVAGVTSFGNTSFGTPRIANGIDVNKSTVGPSSNAIVERNTTYNNADSGIEIYNGSSGAVVRRNLTYDNGDHGIDISKAPNAEVTSNTVMHNANPGLNVEGGSTGVAVRNNIAVDNAIGSTGTHGDIRVDQYSTSGTTLDHDLVFQSSGTGTVIEWNTIDYKTLAAFRSAQPGQEAHGRSGDPGLSSNFVPGDGSPALDSAYSGAPGWLSKDREGNQPFDQPSVTDTGAGPTPYADRGALERTTPTTPPPPPDASPVAKLTVTPAQPEVGDTVTLDASKSTDDHAVTGYAFSCGNGHTVASSSASSTTCTYAAAGTFPTSVTVRDAAGHTDTATESVTVTVAPPPPPPTQAVRAVLSVNHGTTRQMSPVLLSAVGSQPSTGTRIVSYRFSCGMRDVHPATASSTLKCTYRNIGTYAASVVVVDSAGQTARATASVRVLKGARPLARLVLSRHSIGRGRSVRATSRSKGSTGLPITRTRIACGGHRRTFHGAKATMRCTFRRPGRHTVRVVVWNSLGYWSTRTAHVWVRRHR